MEQKEIVITYETLFELLKREKDRVELQKLEPDFFASVLSYLREKKSLLTDAEHQSYDEKMRVHREMDNIRKIIKELYDRREKKIALVAIDQSRTKAHLVDYSHMLKEEREFFDSLSKTFETFRDGILHNVLDQRMPAVHTAIESRRESKEAEQKRSGESSDLSSEKEPQNLSFESQEDQFTDEGESGDQKTTLLVRFLHAVPKFVGPELDEFGPFSEDDIASLPREVANLLKEKGRVEEIHEE